MIRLLDQQKNTALAATVRASGPGWYLVETDSGRTLRAESAQTWAIGTRVTVIDRQITGRAGARPITPIYEV